MNNESRTMLIEQFLDGELQGDNLKNFELKLQNDKEFARDYYLQKEIRNTLANKDVNLLREMLNTIGDRIDKNINAKKRKSVIFYSIFTFVIIATIVSFFIFNKTYTNDELFTLYYKHYDAGIITRGEEQGSKDIFVQAMREYDNSKYVLAIKLFNQVSDTSSYYANKEYFLGLSYMELEKYDEAIIHLTIVSNKWQCVYQDDAIWYNGLCYLKTNQILKAINQFRILQKNDSFYKKQASEILKNI